MAGCCAGEAGFEKSSDTLGARVALGFQMGGGSGNAFAADRRHAAGLVPAWQHWAIP